MSRRAKITISLPTAMPETIEKERKARQVTRSEICRSVVEHAPREQQRRENHERYVGGYLQHPESEAEIRLADRLGREALAAEPWE